MVIDGSSMTVMKLLQTCACVCNWPKQIGIPINQAYPQVAKIAPEPPNQTFPDPPETEPRRLEMQMQYGHNQNIMKVDREVDK
jgi:hypothetical protein